jgi:hypothetical protein
VSKHATYCFFEGAEMPSMNITELCTTAGRFPLFKADLAAEASTQYGTRQEHRRGVGLSSRERDSFARTTLNYDIVSVVPSLCSALLGLCCGLCSFYKWVHLSVTRCMEPGSYRHRTSPRSILQQRCVDGVCRQVDVAHHTASNEDILD